MTGTGQHLSGGLSRRHVTYQPSTKALLHIWLALPTKVSYLNIFDSKSDYTPRADTNARYPELQGSRTMKLTS